MIMRKRSFLLPLCCVSLAHSGASSFVLVQQQQDLSFAVQRASFSVNSRPCTRTSSHQQAKSDEEEEGAEDTIRVRIWRALASGDEISLSQLGQTVGERRLGELRSHLGHVERQAKTLRNKSDDWKVRRGLLPDSQSNDNDSSPFASKAKVRLKTRKGKKNEILVKLA